MLQVISRKGDWAAVVCNDCGQEYDEQWSFCYDNIREWAKSIRDAHVCPPAIDEEFEFDPDNDLEHINLELEQLDRYLNEQDAKSKMKRHAYDRKYATNGVRYSDRK